MTASGTVTIEELLAAGREELARANWERAHASLRSCTELMAEPDPEVLEQLGLAAFWLEDGDTALSARNQAYALYLRAGRDADAGRMATWLAWDHSAFRGEHALAGGWLARAHRALDELPVGAEHAWLALREAARVLGDDAGLARTLGARAASIGSRLGVPDLEIAGRAIEGLALVSLGEVAPGRASLERATGAAAAGTMGDLVLITLVHSQMVDACERIRDFDALALWSERLIELSERWNIRGLTGVARAHRAGALIAQGEFARAELELGAATEQIERTAPGMLPEAWLRSADLRAQQGRLDEAWPLLERCGSHAQRPALAAAVALEQGDPGRAASLAERYLEGFPGRGRLERAPGLELLARGLAASTRDGAPAAAELREIADTAAVDGVSALSARADGAVAAATAQHERALAHRVGAVSLLERTGPRFACGVARIELAETLHALGRSDGACAQAHVARQTLARLGAPLAARRAQTLLDRLKD